MIAGIHNSTFKIHLLKQAKMNIKNYTSTVDASRSIAKIEELLVEIGGSNINKQYAEKVCTGITFLLFDQQLLQTLPFHLSAQVEECFKILWQDVKRPRPETEATIKLQASRTAWKFFAIGLKFNAP